MAGLSALHANGAGIGERYDDEAQRVYETSPGPSRTTSATDRVSRLSPSYLFDEVAVASRAVRGQRRIRHSWQLQACDKEAQTRIGYLHTVAVPAPERWPWACGSAELRRHCVCSRQHKVMRRRRCGQGDPYGIICRHLTTRDPTPIRTYRERTYREMRDQVCWGSRLAGRLV